MGSEVQLFENELEDYIGNSKYKCVCVNTGTSALQLAIEAITNPGDEVLVPSFTYVATFQAITAAGCVPIACDIRKQDLLLDIAALAQDKKLRFHDPRVRSSSN